MHYLLNLYDLASVPHHATDTSFAKSTNNLHFLDTYHHQSGPSSSLKLSSQLVTLLLSNFTGNTVSELYF